MIWLFFWFDKFFAKLLSGRKYSVRFSREGTLLTMITAECYKKESFKRIRTLKSGTRKLYTFMLFFIRILHSNDSWSGPTNVNWTYIGRTHNDFNVSCVERTFKLGFVIRRVVQCSQYFLLVTVQGKFFYMKKPKAIVRKGVPAHPF